MIDVRSCQVIHGNFLERGQNLPNNSIDLVTADPPYYVMNNDDIKFNDRSDMKRNAEFDHFSSYEEFMEFTRKWIELITKKMKKNASFYCFFATQYITDLMRICESVGMIFETCISWHKLNPPPRVRKSGYISACESILFMKMGNPYFKFINVPSMHNFILYKNEDEKNYVIETPLCQGRERVKSKIRNRDGKYPNLHPTQKPISLYDHFISISSKQNMVICDPFAGVGTAIVSAKKNGRYGIGFELRKDYYEAGSIRIKEERRDKNISSKNDSVFKYITTK